MPPGLDDIVIGDGVKRYQALRDVERRLDAVMMRRRLDIQDSIKRDMRRYRTLRVWVSNTVENQPWQLTGMEPEAFDFTSENQATYRVRIEGRLIDGEEEIILPGEDDDAAITKGDQSIRDMDQSREKDDRNDPMDMEQDEQGKQNEDEAKAATSASDDEKSHRPGRSKFSQFFKSITIDFDRSKSLQPDGMSQIGWKRSDKRPGTSSAIAAAAAASTDSEFDCLEFERKGDENINITINLVRDENPERYKLSKPLADLIDSEEEDRAGVVMKVWEYVKAMGLQEDEENRRFQCDERLKAVRILSLMISGLSMIHEMIEAESKSQLLTVIYQVFNSDTVFFPYIPDLIYQHLTPVQPLQIPYTIRVDRAYNTPPSSATNDDNEIGSNRTEINATIETNIDTSSATSPFPPSHYTTYDILVPIEDPVRALYASAMHSPTYLDTLQEINRLDDQLATTAQALSHAKAKHAFQTALARDPARFVRRWVSSQRRDKEVLTGLGTRTGGLGDDGFAGEEWRRGGEASVWASGNARESVGLWLARQRVH